MTEKRFIYCFEGIEDKWETVEEYKYTPCTKDGFQDLCYMLNDLNDENEQLKQFKENVIKWVDSQMKFNAKKYIETEDSHFKNENIDLHNFKVIIGIDSDEENKKRFV